MGHNGGPPLRPRPPGRPTISTPELRERVLDLLGEGKPLRAICRMPGVPTRRTIYNWRLADPDFRRSFDFMQREGYIGLCETVCDEVDRVLSKHGAEKARWVFNLRRQQLARMHPAFFGGKDMKF
jgi:hypothetical protein